MVPVDDTALAVTDTGGPGRPVIYLNGQFASQAYWRQVIAELGSDYRHITYDMRARGRSRRSAAAASFETHVRDVGSVLAARGVDRALVVGWSYGAAVAVHWAGRNPDRALGVVPVDGAYPHDYPDAPRNGSGSGGAGCAGCCRCSPGWAWPRRCPPSSMPRATSSSSRSAPPSARSWTVRPARSGTWSPRAPTSEAAMMKWKARAPPSPRCLSATRTSR
ncbi:alpha/beta fold hydrolase [Nonomuraea recticatena]|uniref:alpha/beta fold hydrolase n=1 Tax=Nonomuraea recticatena TaxID=46178 RepID=UPI00360E1B91